MVLCAKWNTIPFHIKMCNCFNLMEGEALKLMSDMACTENLQVIKLPTREGSLFLGSILECGSEVPRSSSSFSKARSCKACLGFLWDALWTVACGMGTKSFFRIRLRCWLCSFPAEIWTIFYSFSCFIGRNPIENTWSDTITAWAFETMGVPQLPGELGRGLQAHEGFWVDCKPFG